MVMSYWISVLFNPTGSFETSMMKCEIRLSQLIREQFSKEHWTKVVPDMYS